MCSLMGIFTLMSVPVDAFQKDSLGGVFQEGLESLEEYRRQRGITFNYTPRALHPESCRLLSQQECEERDRRVLQTRVEPLGTQKGIVILLKLTDFETLPREQYDILFNSDTRDEELNPTGSVKEYLRENSNGKFNIDFFVLDWVQSPKSEAECAGPNQGVNDEFAECIVPAMELLETLHNDPNDSFDWYDYDLNEDSYIDNLLIVFNGYAAENGAADPAGTPPSNRIRSHSAAFDSPSTYMSPSSGIRPFYYGVAAGFRGAKDFLFMRLNIIAHEFLHTFAMIDLYDLSFISNGCGGYCLMGFPVGQANSATNPGNVGAYTKVFLGWADPIIITQDGLYDAEPSFTTGTIYKIQPESYDPNEYLLIENRPPLGWDIEIWNGGGIVIWHVNEKDGLNNVEQGQTRVRIVQADGNNDLENAVNLGDATDLWVDGMEVNDQGEPNLKSVVNGNPSGLRIFEFSPAQTVAQFRIGGLLPESPTTAPQSESTTTPEVNVTPSPEVDSSSSPVGETTNSPQGGDTAAPSNENNPTPETPVPSNGTSTVVPSSSPATEPAQCLLSVGTSQCDELLSMITPEENCDCYNFCAGEYLGCCVHATECPVLCDGNLVAGCEFESFTTAPSSLPTMLPTEHPTSVPTVAITVSPDLCLVNVGTGDCATLMSTIDVRPECDCYNFCNEDELPCCVFGEGCPPLICSGDFVGGCRADDQVAPIVSECFIQANALPESCDPLLANQDPIPECDCYNYCDGIFVGCCPYNTFCGLRCSGDTVAGCHFDTEPTSAPGPQASASPFHFWPDGFTAPKYDAGEKRRLLGFYHRHENPDL